MRGQTSGPFDWGAELAERANLTAKKLDYYLGIPIIVLIYLFIGPFVRRRRLNVESLRKVGFLKTSAIGDTVILSALGKDLIATKPQVEFFVFTGKSNFQAAKLFFPTATVIALPMLNPFAALRILRKYPMDVLIDFDSWPRINALLCFFSQAYWTVGFSTEGQGRHFLYSSVGIHSKRVHEIENYRSLLGKIDVHSKSLPSFQGLNVGSMKAKIHDHSIILLHPWSGGSQAAKKMWHRTNWIELAGKLKEAGFHIRLSGGPGDIENCRQLLKEAPPGLIEELYPPSLKVLMDELKSVSLVISVDTGVAHLAGALNVPTLVLYGATSPERWGALGKNVCHLKDPQPATIQLGFEESEGKGLELKVATVMAAVQKMLNP